MQLRTAFSWTLVSVVLRYGVKLLGNLTLARLLVPEDFGLAAIVMAVVIGVETITDVGTKPALIRTHRSDDPWLDTAWTLGVVRGIGVGVAIALAAVPLAALFEDPRLAPMIAVTGLMSVLVGLTSISAILVVRDLQMKNLAMVEIAAAIVGYAVMLSWAWVAPSAWALLAGALVSTAMMTVASYFVFGSRRVRLHWDRGVLSELMGFGKWVFLSSLLGFFILQGDRFSVAKLISMEAAGLYAIAVTWAASLQMVFGMFLSRLYLPVAAQLWRRLGPGNPEFLSLRRNVIAAMIVPYSFAAGCSEALISYLYPAAYAGAGPIMTILVVGAWFATLEFLYNDQLMVSGQPKWRFYAQIVSAVVMAGGLVALAGAYTPERIAIVFAGGAVIRASLLIYACDHHDPRQILPDLALTAGFGILALAASGLLGQFRNQLSPLGALAACFVALAPFGAAIAWRVLRDILRLAEDRNAAVPAV